jgi:Zn-dependent peptidase ImmA (M78 family)
LQKWLRSSGGFIVEYPEQGIPFDGLSGHAEGRPVVVVNGESSVDRYRYNVAHELGHLLMFCPDLTPKEEEALAHRFAAALLVPAEVAKWELGEKRRHLTFPELGVLKEKYGLSMQAWVRRARDLEIISEGLYKSLCIEFSSKGWRKHEPYGYSGHEKKPKRLVQMALRAVAEGIITREEADRICANCGVDPMAAVEKATSDTWSPTELLRLRRAQHARVLADAAARAEKDCRNNPDLTDFNAFGEDDLYAEVAGSETR